METDKIYVLREKTYKWSDADFLSTNADYKYFHTLENLLEYVKQKSYKNIIMHEDECYSESSDDPIDPTCGKWHTDFYWEKEPLKFED